VSVVNVQDLQTGQVYPLRLGESLRIGRQDPTSQPDLPCKDPHVSRRHCELQLVAGNRIRVRDTSSYGTYINEQKVDREAYARAGDRLRLGYKYTVVILEPVAAGMPTQLEGRKPGAGDETVLTVTPGHAPSQLGKYEIERELGQGGMGVVYKAYDPDRDQPCAIKVLRDSSEDDGAERFRREARLAQLLGDYPAIVKVYDWGQVGPRALYLVMDFVDGKSLTDHIREGLDRLIGSRLVSRTARAVAYAHDKGVVHRDLKPDNVLVTRDFQVRLTDFGIAKEDGSGLTLTGMAMGTPNYMAPEQIEDSKRAGPLADVYGLGGLLYTVICRQPPYTGKSVGTVLRKVQQGALDLPRDLVPDLEPDLEAICLKALAREPSERYESAEAFSRALDEWVKGRLGKSGPVRLKGPGEE